jgi:septum site-determining protein MinC
MTTTINAATNQCFKLKGSLFTLTILLLLDAESKEFSTQLAATIQQSPQFFRHAPVVLDVSEIHNDQNKINLTAITQELRKQGMIPVGIRGANDKLKECAIDLGLAFLNTHLPELPTITKDDNKNNKTATSSENNRSLNKTRIITHPVRSGQQVYAEGSDLIILGSVSPGAEILADGNIHVYGIVRGRVLAGIMGDTSARIFCKSLAAELISIAGRYLVSENIKHDDENQAIQIYLEQNQLCIAPL